MFETQFQNILKHVVSRLYVIKVLFYLSLCISKYTILIQILKKCSMSEIEDLIFLFVGNENIFFIQKIVSRHKGLQNKLLGKFLMFSKKF